MARYESRVAIACTPEAAFDFLIRPANALATNPPNVSLTILDAPDVLGRGSRVAFQVQAYGQTQKFLHEIVEFDSPRRFVERQVEGLFRSYVHEHLVTGDGERVEVVDVIEFTPPGGLLGFVLTERRIRDGLDSSFEHRHREMKRLLERDGT